MPDYHVKHNTITVGGTDYLIYSLPEFQQCSDPQDETEELAGISPSSWPLFGQIWSPTKALIHAMHTFELAGKCVMEIGTDLALSSLVIHHQAWDMTVSDWRPLGQGFLGKNLLLNKLGPMIYKTGNREGSAPELSQFDLIIAQDHGMLVDFYREMTVLAYLFVTRRAYSFVENGGPIKKHSPTFTRSLKLGQS